MVCPVYRRLRYRPRSCDGNKCAFVRVDTSQERVKVGIDRHETRNKVFQNVCVIFIVRTQGNRSYVDFETIHKLVFGIS